MPKEIKGPLAESTTEPGARTRRRFQSTLLVVLAVLSLEVSLPASEPAPGEGSYRWHRLENPDDYTSLCRQDEAGTWLCDSTCPGGLGAICAEFRNASRHILETCCIPWAEEGGLNINACILGVRLFRGEEPPPEFYPSV